MIDRNAYKFLKELNTKHSFGDVLTLGRQELNDIPDYVDDKYADDLFLKSFKAKSINSLDVSSFENATIIHDLNKSISQKLHENFDLVYDGGTLEHVFNFPFAVKNAMSMVRVGGYLVIHTITNNYCGHGFYQFSPELFYSIFIKENGFLIERMIIHSVGPYSKWYAVLNPIEIKERVELITSVPMMLLISAKRINLSPIFYSFPFQNDFKPRWNIDESIKEEVEKPSLFKSIKTGWNLFRNNSIRNRKFFKVIS